jgi:DNA-binding transcriptional regulator YiaG
MRTYNLKQAEVARLLGVSKTTVTYWFQDRLRCPDNAAELLRSMCETISPEYLERLKHGAP